MLKQLHLTVLIYKGNCVVSLQGTIREPSPETKSAELFLSVFSSQN